jgi:hypothetical protein
VSHRSRPLGFTPIALDFVRNDGEITSVAVTVNASLGDTAMLLRVLRGNPHGPERTSDDFAQGRDVVFEKQLPMRNIPSSMIPSQAEGDRGSFALSTWSGTLFPHDWIGGCQKALYSVTAWVSALTDPGFADGNRTGSAWFSCAGYVCPVCMYPGLGDPPWQDGEPSHEICPSCGTQFGRDDGIDDPTNTPVYLKLRERWDAAGKPWYSTDTPQPADWPPHEWYPPPPRPRGRPSA